MKEPVYISLTTIFRNQEKAYLAIQSILNQTKKPDKIFLYLSEESYILDDGFKDKKITNPELLKLINDSSIIDLKWVANTGSYRKLLPLLKEKWKEDCIIITIDDDTVHPNNLIENLVADYFKHKCVINYRGFTPQFDRIENFNYEKRKGGGGLTKLTAEQKLSLYNFSTGKGGVLYKPEFFHKTKDLIFNEEIYLDTCDKHDDIWFYLVRILNNINCFIGRKKWQQRDIASFGLFHHFNQKNNNNTRAFKKTINKLKSLGYKF
tara:strand:- start:118 stop:909 length:792 start_codon:yes stop_codon:yes gene_type:complete